uniref:Uncharacterized protein n=1 Tax=Cacopsylla melanoneura TaxID=428564 RepID=A0A8D8RL36_9HEMI
MSSNLVDLVFILQFSFYFYWQVLVYLFKAFASMKLEISIKITRLHSSEDFKRSMPPIPMVYESSSFKFLHSQPADSKVSCSFYGRAERERRHSNPCTFYGSIN